MKGKKGFTLIELLAVIVILAILMVAAGTAVVSTMSNSKVNTFKDEALQAIDSAKMMFTDVSMDQNSKYMVQTVDNNTDNFKGMCFTLHGLVENGYLDKDLGDDYKGIVLITVSQDESTTNYYTYMTNGVYGIDGLEKNEINNASLKNKKVINNLKVTEDTNTLETTGIVLTHGHNPGTTQTLKSKLDYVYASEQLNISRTGTHQYHFQPITCINSKL